MAAAAATTPEIMSMNQTKNEKKTLDASSSSVKSNKKFNLNILRPPRLNLERKSSNVTSDSTLSVKIAESPV